ncbi:MAG: octanoyltransferase, partial [Geodermatophilaceae bacterium]|nr:octanoyltransferase [Geodermatophilaceae bacterium]
MGTDVALMRRAARTGETVLRVYGWSGPVLSLGRNQRARHAYREDELARQDIGVVRRPTGGRALLHHGEITYSVTSPCPAGVALASEYRRINNILIAALRELGVKASVARPACRMPAPDLALCFAEPAAGEIVAAGRKLVGSAQWRDGGALLQHGSILVDDDQSRLG